MSNEKAIPIAKPITVSSSDELDSNEVKVMLWEALGFETQLCSLYMHYSRFFPDHEKFWSKLAHDEIKHASYIRNGIDNLVDISLFPDDILKVVARGFEECDFLINQTLFNMFAYPETVTLRNSVDFALRIERESLEIVFQKLLSTMASKSVTLVFQTLNEDTGNHVKMLEEFRRTHL